MRIIRDHPENVDGSQYFAAFTSEGREEHEFLAHITYIMSLGGTLLYVPWKSVDGREGATLQFGVLRTQPEEATLAADAPAEEPHE